MDCSLALVLEDTWRVADQRSHHCATVILAPLMGEPVEEMLGRTEVCDQTVDVPRLWQLRRIVPHVRWGHIDRSCQRRPRTSVRRIRPH